MAYAQPVASFLPPAAGQVAATLPPANRGTRPPVTSSRAVGAGRATRPPQRQQAPAAARPATNGHQNGAPQVQASMAQQLQAKQAPVQQQAAPVQVVKIPAMSQQYIPPSPVKWGLVKQVNSGDTITVSGCATGPQAQNPLYIPPTKQFSISNIRAPALARSSTGREDAWGWESREFLRKLLIGQHVQFGDEWTDSWKQGTRQLSRDYATVLFQGQPLAERVLAEGMATLTPMKREQIKELEATASKGDVNAQRKLLARNRCREIENQAKEAQKGVHAMGPDDEAEREKFIAASFRRTNWPSEIDEMGELFKNMQGKKVRAIVEKVVWGSCLQLELLPEGDNDAHTLVRVTLAGVSCPRTPRNLEMRQMQWDRKFKGRKNPPEARPTEENEAPIMSREAQNYVEVRLLNREVIVSGKCKDAYNNLYVTVAPANAPTRDINVYLLQMGLAEIVPWSMRKLPGAVQQRYISAAKQAQAGKLGIWKTKSPPIEKRQNEGRVVQVISGDSVVLAGADGKEFRAQLASIRAPKLGNRYDNAGPEPWALDAKEFLRCKLINQPVKIKIEYKRARDRPDMIKRYGPDQIFVSLFAGEKLENVSLSLVNLGYAECVLHGQKDPKADAYATMLERQAEAKTKKIGKWGDESKQRYAHPHEDLSVRFGRRGQEDPRAQRVVRGCQNLFQSIGPKKRGFDEPPKEGKRIDGCVEHVFSGSRLKIAVPAENKIIILVLVGLQSDRYTEDSQGHVKEAYRMVRDVLLQRNIKFSVEAVDRGGNFIGHVWLGNKQNLGEELLRRGLAKCRKEGLRNRDGSARSFRTDELEGAEKEAKEGRVGCWEGYDPAEDTSLNTASGSPSKQGGGQRQQEQKSLAGKTVEGYSTHIQDATTFYLQVGTDENVAKIEKLLTQVDSSKKFEKGGKVRLGKGKVVAAAYDGSYYRCRYEGRAGANARVTFLDYGNQDIVEMDALVQLDGELKTLPSTAYRCSLAGVKPPPAKRNPQYFEDAGKFFAAQIDGKNLTVNVLYTDKGTNFVRVLDDNGDDVNEMLVKAGHARLPNRQPEELVKAAKEFVADLDTARKDAFRSHSGMWEYGDPGSDNEEEDFRPVGRFNN